MGVDNEVMLKIFRSTKRELVVQGTGLDGLEEQPELEEEQLGLDMMLQSGK